MGIGVNLIKVSRVLSEDIWNERKTNNANRFLDI